VLLLLVYVLRALLFLPLQQPLLALLKNTLVMAANSMGVSSIRCPSLLNGGAWIDEACEGYWDLGDHLRSICSFAVSRNGRFMATVAEFEYRCVVHMVRQVSVCAVSPCACVRACVRACMRMTAPACN
jgi:hypothetical protein